MNVWGLCLFLSLGAEALPSPPPSLAPWVEYAKERYATDPGCPPNAACVQVQRLVVTGDVDAGNVTLRFVGKNLGTKEVSTPLLGPARALSLVDATFARGRGAVFLREQHWGAAIAPGDFELSVRLSFAPSLSVPVSLQIAAAHIDTQLSRGKVSFDESSDAHGGVMFLEAQSTGTKIAAPVTVRVSRAFHFGSLMTFTYRYSFFGVNEQTRLGLALLGGELIEAVRPELPYSAGNTLQVTVSPGTSSFEVEGHFAKAPQTLTKPKELPFEQWLFVTDARHPVDLATTGVEIDPTEVRDMPANKDARAFFLSESQSLTITPLDVEVDRGRQGEGTADLTYVQGADDGWVGSLLLTTRSAPSSDRIAIPTPAPPTYAEIGGEAVRLFGHNGVLSLRNLAEDGALLPIRVQWREQLNTNAVLSVVNLHLPPQPLHLEQERGRVQLLPGYVPALVLGTEHAQGHLLDGLHLYALLLAALAVALARAAKFPTWATAITFVLFVGLYTVEDFPRTLLLLLLLGCAVWVRLPERALVGLWRERLWSRVAVLLWVAVVVAALIPSGLYVRERVLSALHPWVTLEDNDNSNVYPTAPAAALSRGMGGAPKPEAPQEANDIEYDQEEAYSDRNKKKDGLSSKLSSVRKKSQASSQQAVEKTMRPVALEGSRLSGNEVTYGFGSLLPGDSGKARLLIVGPMLRGLWMFLECAGLIALLALALMRGRRLWQVAGGAA